MESSVYLRIGKKLRRIRQDNKATLVDIADCAGVSKSLLSKIENGRTIPSLPVLLQIIKALKTDVSIFFEGITDDISYGFVHKKQYDYQPDEKEESEGFSYFSILDENIGGMVMQTALLKLFPKASREKVVTDGYTFLYLVEGKIDYVLGDETVLFEKGDSLFFDGRIPHVPLNNSDQPATILVIYLLTPTNQ